MIERRKFISLLGGALAAGPLPARAQQGAMPVIGFLSANATGDVVPQLAGFKQGLGEAGFVEGQNVAIEYRWAENVYDRLPALAAGLVARKVDVIVANTPPAARAAKTATSTIPIVFGVGSDPVADGLVASLARPGGNLTGFTLLGTDLTAKRLDLLSQLAPKARLFTLLLNPANQTPWIGGVQETARAKGLQLLILKATANSEIDAAFAAMAEARSDALLVGDDPFLYAQRPQITALALRHRIPVIGQYRGFADDGALISYGPSLRDAYRLIGNYAGKILKGAKPADLPVQQPTRFETVLNLKTAAALGLTVPPILLAQADELIE